MFSPKKDETEERASCGHEPELEKLRKEVDEGKVELEKMRKEVDESRVEINMLKSSLEAAKRELAQEMAHVEELKQSKELDQRGSFTSSLIDAMQQDMQQQIANEKEMKEKYKHRLDAMITEMTQVGRVVWGYSAGDRHVLY